MKHAAAIESADAQSAGRRPTQEDACGVSAATDAHFLAHGGRLAVLCDGMGGMRHGAEASRLAVRSFMAAYEAKRPDETIADALRRALAVANQVVYEAAQRHGARGQMGCTLVALVVHGHTLHVIHAGDSRAYLWHAGKLRLITHDHNYARILRDYVARREITESEAQQHPRRVQLTSYLGRQAVPQVDTSEEQLADGAWLLLCSDGLHGTLDESAIGAELYGAPQQAAQRLIDRALERQDPDQDNVTVVVMALDPQTGWRTGRSQSRPQWDVPDEVRRSPRFAGLPARLLGAGVALSMASALVGAWVWQQWSTANAAPAAPTIQGVTTTQSLGSASDTQVSPGPSAPHTTSPSPGARGATSAAGGGLWGLLRDRAKPPADDKTPPAGAHRPAQHGSSRNSPEAIDAAKRHRMLSEPQGPASSPSAPSSSTHANSDPT